MIETIRSAAPVVFLRGHGQTTLNAEDRLHGLSDPPLDSVGLAEARALAEAMADKHPTVVINSPLQRAIATADATTATTQVRLVVDARLQDRDYGDQTGKQKADVVAEFGSVDAVPGVESARHLTARARAGFRQLVDEYGPGPLVFVAHDAINKTILADIDPTLTCATDRLLERAALPRGCLACGAL